MEKTEGKQPGRIWYLAPILFGILGGAIGYFAVRDRDKKMAESLLIVGLVITFVVPLLILPFMAGIIASLLGGAPVVGIAPISFYSFMGFGFLFGFVFPDLLEELGLKRDKSHSGIAVLALGFIALLAFFARYALTFGVLQLANEPFYGTVEFWLAVSLLLGGAAHLGLHFAKYKEKPQLF